VPVVLQAAGLLRVLNRTGSEILLRFGHGAQGWGRRVVRDV
jgi:hypothetical protein